MSNDDHRAPMDVVWDFMQPQFRNSLLVLGDQERRWAGCSWSMLPDVVKTAVVQAIESMSESALRRDGRG